MGRRKKNPDLSEVGKISSKNTNDNNNIFDEETAKNMKKWEKIINKAFNQKMQYEDESLYAKVNEKFQTDQEVKNIISELYIKIKNCDYFVKKQWLTLKKFNLHEKIYREETKIILANEKQKLNEIYTEAIEKLAACHMIGFEPLTIIRTKILNKLQIKYSISEENIKELANHFNSSEEDDELLNQKRHDDQLAALKKMISNTSLFNYKEVDKTTYLNAKTEIKKYEKELELKATQNEIVEENSSTIANHENEGFTFFEEKKRNSTIESENEFDDDESKLKIGDLISPITDEKIKEEKEKCRNNILAEIKEKNYTIESNQKQFKSEILNNLYRKIKLCGKLSDFDVQILLYVFHSVTNELNVSKNTKREYNCEILPLDLMKFLKMFKIDINEYEKNNNEYSSSVTPMTVNTKENHDIIME